MAKSAFQIELDSITLRRAQRGDVRAFERVYKLFQRPSYTLALRICHCPDMAQEIIQDAFIVLYKRIGQFRGESPFWGWLRRIIVNHSISALRRRRTDLSIDQTPLELVGDRSLKAEVELDLAQALGKLSDKDRIVVWLHDVEGYRHREIGELLNMSESYSKSRLSRARRRLKDMMKQNNESQDCAAKSTSGAPLQSPLQVEMT